VVAFGGKQRAIPQKALRTLNKADIKPKRKYVRKVKQPKADEEEEGAVDGLVESNQGKEVNDEDQKDKTKKKKIKKQNNIENTSESVKIEQKAEIDDLNEDKKGNKQKNKQKDNIEAKDKGINSKANLKLPEKFTLSKQVDNYLKEVLNVKEIAKVSRCLRQGILKG